MKLQTKVSALKKRLNSVDAELLATQHELQTSAAEIQKFRTMNSETKQKLVSTESEVRALKLERTALVVSEHRATTASSSLSARIRDLETEVSLVKKDLERKDSELRDTQLERDRLTRDPPSGSTTMYIDMLETRLAFKNLKSEVRKVLEWCEVKCDWKSAEEGTEPYKDELAALSSRCCDLAKYEAECLDLRSSRVKLKAEIRNLRERLGDTTDAPIQLGPGRPPKASKQVSALKQEVARLQRQLVSIPASSFWPPAPRPLSSTLIPSMSTNPKLKSFDSDLDSRFNIKKRKTTP